MQARFRLLGPLEVWSGDQRIPLAGARHQRVLGMLLLAAGRVVPVDRLIEAGWDEEPPATAARQVRKIVANLRHGLPAGPDLIVTEGPGYRMVLAEDQLDLSQFNAAVASAKHADAATAVAALRAALALWRGPVMAGVGGRVIESIGVILEERRLAAAERLLGLRLGLGEAREIVDELRELAAEHPTRESVRGMLMIALYRSGRRADALDEYSRLRSYLAEELGIDPGRALQDLQQRILNADPALDLAAPPGLGPAESPAPVVQHATPRVAAEELGRHPELAGLPAQVLADDPSLAAPAAAAVPGSAAPPQAAEAGMASRVVPRQLPAGAAFFAGRERELKELHELLGRARPGGGEDGADGPGEAVAISAVAGMAGVGKTALAVQWARKVAGRFPDGQLYVNLRGYDSEGAAVTAAEVTGWFLVALGVPVGQIPADAQARCGLYRSVLAGRRVLIVLDNARDAAQVRPLLPGSAGCLVVVTSRSSLAGLAAAEGARQLRLGPLADVEGMRLLAARLGPERVAAERGAATELVARCGHLPLALAVMAARAAANPELPLGVLAGQLAAAANGEDALPAGGAGPGRLEVLETGDPATSLRQLLSWSYRQLSPPAAQMFALLGVHCGPDITVPAAASLAGVSRAEAGRALAELADASLAAEHRPGRYLLHDLVRGFAAGVARQALDEPGIRAAIERSLDHYLHTGSISGDLPKPFTLAPRAPGVLPEKLRSEAELQNWAQANQQVELQAITQAAAAGFITRAWQMLLFFGQAWSLGDQGYWADCLAAAKVVLAVAEAADDQVALGWTHVTIGRHGTFTGAHDEYRAHLARALDHFRRAADLSGQAWAYLFASGACATRGDLAEAVEQAGHALPLFRQTGDPYGKGWALAILGTCHARLGDYELARGYAGQALQVTGDPTVSAMAWHARAFVHSQLGHSRQAVSGYRQALALVRDRKHPTARGVLVIMLTEFGDVCRAAGDLPAATEAWQQAAQVLSDLGWPDVLEVGTRLEQAEASRGRQRHATPYATESASP
jgi:DNA-binding SARP family transcriptional activator/tetratricopeptide (TPR) repeat protein